MTILSRTLGITGLFGFLLIGAASHAGPIVPVGLNPGDQYYLTFLTSGGRDGTSSNLSDYNTFVQSQAALNPVVTGTDVGVQWRAVASTETDNAVDNIGLLANTPIYLLDGTTKVANGSADWWGGTHLAPIDLTQLLTGDTYPFQVWTGTFIDGTANLPLGSALSLPHPTLGGDQSIIDAWVYDWPHAPVEEGAAAIRPLYAVSELLTVVPEPSGVSLAGIGLLGLAVWKRLRRRR